MTRSIDEHNRRLFDMMDDTLAHAEINPGAPKDSPINFVTEENHRPLLPETSTFFLPPPLTAVYGGQTTPQSLSIMPLRSSPFQETGSQRDVFSHPSSSYDTNTPFLPSLLPTNFAPTINYLSTSRQNVPNTFLSSLAHRDISRTLVKQQDVRATLTDNRFIHSIESSISRSGNAGPVSNPSTIGSSNRKKVYSPLSVRIGAGLGVKSRRVDKTKPVCTKCDPPRFFSRNHNLKIHQRIHTGEKPYMCPIPNCAKEYKWKSSIISHLTWHRRQGDVVETKVPLSLACAESNNNTRTLNSVDVRDAASNNVSHGRKFSQLRNSSSTATHTGAGSFLAPTTKHTETPFSMSDSAYPHGHSSGDALLQFPNLPDIPRLPPLMRFIPPVPNAPNAPNVQTALIHSGVIPDMPNDTEEN